MKAWRRAFLYVTRKTGKMVLLLVLFLTIMTLVLVDTAISQASEGTAARLREERLADTLRLRPTIRRWTSFRRWISL